MDLLKYTRFSSKYVCLVKSEKFSFKFLFFCARACGFCTIRFRINPTFENERHSSNDVDERNLPGDTRAYIGESEGETLSERGVRRIDGNRG